MTNKQRASLLLRLVALVLALAGIVLMAFTPAYQFTHGITYSIF